VLLPSIGLLLLPEFVSGFPPPLVSLEAFVSLEESVSPPSESEPEFVSSLLPPFSTPDSDL